MRGLLVVFMVVFSVTSFAQSNGRSQCGDRYFMTSKTRPLFGESSKEIGEYLSNQVKVTSMKRSRGIFVVNINCNGEIFHNEMIRGNMSKETMQSVSNALSEMPRWTPANYDGPVDYQFYLDILCEGGNMRVNPIMR